MKFKIFLGSILHLISFDIVSYVSWGASCHDG
jgi:hypothetical protein